MTVFVVIYIVLIFLIVSGVLWKLASDDIKRRRILSMNGHELDKCKKEYDRVMEVSRYGLEKQYHTEESKKYQSWMRLKYGNINAENDCHAVLAGMFLAVVVTWFCFYYRHEDLLSIILPFIVSIVSAVILSIPFCSLSSAIVEKVHTDRKRNIKYWIVCVLSCLATTFLATLLLYYIKDCINEFGD